MNYIDKMNQRIDFLDDAVISCIINRRYGMAELWAIKADKLEKQRDEFSRRPIAQPTNGYHF
jgi:hypothetical protein